MSLAPVLFTTAPDIIDQLTSVVDPTKRPSAVVVDWEHRGKADRQSAADTRIGTDTQLGHDRPEDLARVASQLDVPVVCRIDAPSHETPDQIDLAVRLGADEVLLPMVQTADEVERALSHAAGRVGIGVMVETAAAVEHITELAELPLTRIYIGLVDLALDRGTPSIFTALVDGTADHVAKHVDAVPLGAGGLTLPGGGDPIPVRLLAGELVRLGCAFSFLRRSFLRDLGALPPGEGIARVRSMTAELAIRTPAEVEADRYALVDAVARLEGRSP
jgi:hypothetical protein